MSAGTATVAALAAAIPEQLAAAALIIGGRYIDPGPDAGPLPIVAHQESGAAAGVMRQWAAHNGCDSTSTVEQPAAGVTVSRWGGCRDGADVELWVLDGMGHHVAADDCSFLPAAVRDLWCYETPVAAMSTVVEAFFEAHQRTA